MGSPRPVRRAHSTGWLQVAVIAVIIGGLSVIGLWYASSANRVEVDQGISITLPEGWKKVRSGTVSGMATHSYRGEPSEKVALNLMLRRKVPAEIRTKAYQSEALLAMAAAIVGQQQTPPVVTDLSHDEVVHVQTTIDDTAILPTPSAQLAADDFKHLCLGTIIRGGDFIHYEIPFDEENAVFHTLMQGVDALAWGR